jgi:hypothetical protein
MAREDDRVTATRWENQIMAQSAASRRAFIAKRYARRAAGDVNWGTRRPANDNARRTDGPNLGRSMTVAMNDACLEAAGFAEHASY